MATTSTTAHRESRLSPKAPARITAVHMGIVSAILAVVAGAWFEVGPPSAYGICMACHGRDLVDWTINRLAHTHLTVAEASLVYPVLTTIGALLGALFGSLTNGEFRWRMPDHPMKDFVYGALVMTCALIAGGCSIRLLLRSASGEALGAMGFAGMAAGVVAATFWLRWRATR